jgi:hypothetical protein
MVTVRDTSLMLGVSPSRCNAGHGVVANRPGASGNRAVTGTAVEQPDSTKVVSNRVRVSSSIFLEPGLF